MTEKTPTQAAEELTSALEKMFSPDDPLSGLLARVEADVSKVDKAALQRLIEALWGLGQSIDGIAEDLSRAD
jgi:hypothetical protein